MAGGGPPQPRGISISPLLVWLLCTFVPAVVGPEGWDSGVKTASTQHARDTLSQALLDHTVVIFSRAQCAASRKVKSYFEDEGIPYYALELDQRNDGDALKSALQEASGSSKLPKVYIRGQLVGGSYEVNRAKKSGELNHWIDDENRIRVPIATA